MKVFKKNEHSLLIKTFGIADTQYMACTVLMYFDLTAPDEPLKEQEMWTDIPPLLGGQGILDQGMPKPRGEVLVTGKCFTPNREPRGASRISVRVGAMQKTLDVFGRRYWKGVAGTMRRISDPEPFTEMPVVWENAFGGPGFERNPVGKGMATSLDSTGQEVHPLPGIEYSDRLIGSPDDRPRPAGFGPMDVTWPQRQGKAGTYDDKWQRERWPCFPDDMNYEFFNAAPEDQFIQGYFTGNEAVEVIGMHPDLPRIASRLPGLRIRCFVTKKRSLRPGDRDEPDFQEVKTHIDTVWLFPEILRGVVMFRGSTPILDDEYADVVRIFLATEKMAEDPRPMGDYFEEQKRLANLTVPIDRSPWRGPNRRWGRR